MSVCQQSSASQGWLRDGAQAELNRFQSRLGTCHGGRGWRAWGQGRDLPQISGYPCLQMPQEVLEPFCCTKTLEHSKIMQVFQECNVRLNVKHTSHLLPAGFKLYSFHISWSSVVFSPPGLRACYIHCHPLTVVPKTQFPKVSTAHIVSNSSSVF